MRFDASCDGTGRAWVAGEVDLSTSDRLRETLRPLTESPAPVTIDLAKLEFLDGSGIRVLAELALAVAPHPVRIVGATGIVRRVLELTLDGIVRIEPARQGP